MWNCQSCGAENEETFDFCWSCQIDRDVTVKVADDLKLTQLLPCLRCNEQMAYVGSGAFTNWLRWGVWWHVMRMFYTSDNFDIYACRHCGQVELFLADVGQERRPQ